MKKATYIFLTMTILFSCKSGSEERSIAEYLTGIRWENSDLDFIGFDSTFVFLPINEMYLLPYSFKYSLKSDTLIIINKSNDAYNFKDFENPISHVRILIFDKDSIKLELLNEGSKELFEGFNNFTFYNSNAIDRYSYYNEKDSNCLNQINRAKEEINNGSLVFCIHPRWPFRQEEELIALLNIHGVKYRDLGPFPDVLPISRNCYNETMDYFIQRKFGESFIDSLMREADSLMVQNNRSKFIKYYACDERPYRPKSESGYDNSLTAMVDLPIKYSIEEWKSTKTQTVSRPFMDIGFYIDTTGVISNFYLNYFNPELNWNIKYKETLFKLGVERIKEDSVWIPGKILGIKVRTDNNVRIFFERKSE